VSSAALADDAAPNVLYIIANLPGPESPVSWFYNQESTAMNSYQLASIPKFDKQHKAIARAAKSREWSTLIAEFDKLPTSEQANVLGKVSELIFVEGLLIVRFPDEEAENRRNAFKRWLAISMKPGFGTIRSVQATHERRKAVIQTLDA
jgi:hypothetical protein